VISVDGENDHKRTTAPVCAHRCQKRFRLWQPLKRV